MQHGEFNPTSIPACHHPKLPTFSSHNNNNNNGINEPTKTHDTEVEMLKLMFGDWPSVCVCVCIGGQGKNGAGRPEDRAVTRPVYRPAV